MTAPIWKTKQLSVAGLHLDTKNPRLGRETATRAPREIIQYLFEHDDALEVAASIATRGYFPNEPLLAINEDGKIVVVEGNRRLAALKALREPGLLEGPIRKRVERFTQRITSPQALATVPVTLASNRRATDKQVAARHVGTPVKAWQAENRASFILEKLSEGYTNDELSDELGFTLGDIQAARQTRAIADMARSLDLPEEVRAKIDNPRAKLFSTLERVFESSAGREALMVEPDASHGFRGTTSKAEFIKGFTKLVTDVVLGRVSSRTLNTGEDIRGYFDSWKPADRPAKRSGSFVASDVITGKSVASPKASGKAEPAKKGKFDWKTVLPRSFKVRFGTDRLGELRDELVQLDRRKFVNAGSVLLRVFLELSMLDYLERAGMLKDLVRRIEEKLNGKLRFGVPEMKHLATAMVAIAKERLLAADAVRVEKALRPDPSAPFTISDLNSFVHSKDLPSDRDIQQFWARTEPLFRMMLEQEIPAPPK